MTARSARRLALTSVAALAVVDVVLASSHRHRAHTAFLGPIGGPRYGLLVAGLGLLATLPSLRAAKRNAWCVALGLAAASVLGGLVAAVAASVTGGVLIAHRRWFAVPPDPMRTRRAWTLLAAGEVLVLAYGVGGLLLFDAGFRRSPSVIAAVGAGARLLLLLPAGLQAGGRDGMWLIGSVRFLSLAVALVGLAAVLRATIVGPPRHLAEKGRIERLVDRWAATSLAPFHLLDDKSWFVGADGKAFVSYKLVGRVAVVLGGPVGPAGGRPQVIDEFVERCHLNGWVPAFHQVDAADAPLLEARGLRLLKIGAEAVVDLATFSLDGHGKKTMRSALRRVERSGHRVEELPQPLDEATLAELRDVSDAWLAAGNHRERTFTVGQFDPEYLRSTPVVVVRDAGGRIVAFTNVLPSYGSSVGNFDLMRRRPDSVNGVMEFLLVALIERFQREGKEAMTLGLAPLANLDGDGLPDRALRLLRDRAGAAFSYEGLAGFKSRWGPRWEDRYLAYPASTDLVRVGLAVARAGELPTHTRATARVAAVARRLPFSIAALSIAAWLSVATSVDPRLQRFLMHRFGVSWTTLVHGQWWRLATATLVQPRAGVVWSNVLLLTFLPWAERRFGSRRTIALFFVSDWVSTLLSLGGLRVVAGWGSAAAAVALREHQAGPSAAAYALLAALAVTIGDRRWRTIAVVTVGLSILGPLAVYHRMFDVEHLLAAAVGAAWQGRLWAAAVPATREGGDHERSPHPVLSGVPGHRPGRRD